VQVEVNLPKSKLRFHDVDNLLKHLFDALQGRLGGKGRENRHPRSAVEERPPDPARHDPQEPKLKSRLIVHDYVRMKGVRHRSAGSK
jgi:hypothetical protein